MNIRKPNRDSSPVRITQAGTSTRYPHADHRAMAIARTRWFGADLDLSAEGDRDEPDEAN